MNKEELINDLKNKKNSLDYMDLEHKEAKERYLMLEDIISKLEKLDEPKPTLSGKKWLSRKLKEMEAEKRNRGFELHDKKELNIYEEREKEASLNISQSYSNVLGLLDQLDEPEKAVVPKEVDELIHRGKELGDTLSVLFARIYIASWHGSSYQEISEWAIRNPYLFAKAWVEGYEVEQEQKYYIKILNAHVSLSPLGDEYLWYSDDQMIGKQQFTEEEIKEMNPSYWGFAVRVEEIDHD